MNLKKYIRTIPDYPKKGILFRDISTLLKNEKGFTKTIDELVLISKKIDFDKIAAIESRGFVFASALSYILKKPFLMFRKKINYQLKHFQLILNLNTEKQLLKFIKTLSVKVKKF